MTVDFEVLKGVAVDEIFVTYFNEAGCIQKMSEIIGKRKLKALCEHLTEKNDYSMMCRSLIKKAEMRLGKEGLSKGEKYEIYEILYWLTSVGDKEKIIDSVFVEMRDYLNRKVIDGIDRLLN